MSRAAAATVASGSMVTSTTLISSPAVRAPGHEHATVHVSRTPAPAFDGLGFRDGGHEVGFRDHPEQSTSSPTTLTARTAATKGVEATSGTGARGGTDTTAVV